MSQKPTKKVYRAQPLDGYEWLLPVDREDYEKLKFDGTVRAESWVPVRVKRIRQEKGGPLWRPGDFPAGSGFVVTSAAREQLDPFLLEAGELLPLECLDGEFWTLNVTRLIPALDEEGSKLLRSSETGRILMINRHNFRSERLGPEIFKLTQTPGGLIYFGEAFVEHVKATSLKGIDFKLVWAPN